MSAALTGLLLGLCLLLCSNVFISEATLQQLLSFDHSSFFTCALRCRWAKSRARGCSWSCRACASCSCFKQSPGQPDLESSLLGVPLSGSAEGRAAKPDASHVRSDSRWTLYSRVPAAALAA